MNRSDPSLASAPSLVSRLLQQAMSLVETELALVKAELAQNLARMGNGAALCAAAALFALTALHVMAAAAVLALIALGLAPVWASVAVGSGFVLMAGALFLVGRARLSITSLQPKRTLRNLRADIETLEEIKRA